MSKSSQRPGFGPRAGHGAMSFDKPKDFKNTSKRLINYLKPFWIKISIVITLAIFSTMFAISAPKILGEITNEVASGIIERKVYDQITTVIPVEQISQMTGEQLVTMLEQMPQFEEYKDKIPPDMLSTLRKMDLSQRPDIDFNVIGKIAILLLGIYFISSAFGYIQHFIMSGISMRITHKFRKDLSDKINKIPLKYYDQKTYGEILSRVTNDVDTVSNSLQQVMNQVITSVVTVIGVLIMMLSISVYMTLVALLVIPLSLLLVTNIIKRSQKFFKEQQKSLGQLNGHVEEMYGGHNVVKAFNGEEKSIEQFKNINEKLYSSSWKSQFLSGLMMPSISFINNLGYVGVCVLGGYLAINNLLNIGDIQAFIQYMSSFGQPITQVANIMNIMQSAIAASERVFEFLDEIEEVPDKANYIQVDNVEGSVTFNNVHFGYIDNQTIINNFNMKVKPGQKIAIVGPTGAGKTTIINLLMRFYDVNSGAIKIDDVDIRDMRRQDLRQIFGMVLQDTWLFKGTIKENIVFSNENASEQEIIQACKEARVDHFVKTLSHGYDTLINEEASNISSGQKQLLTIVRAILKDPKILILDEATSNVDTRTEVLIQEAMNNLMKNRTTFIIAHRLSTIKNADLIIVMNKGDIVESGTHFELLEKNGFYTNMYLSQFEVA